MAGPFEFEMFDDDCEAASSSEAERHAEERVAARQFELAAAVWDLTRLYRDTGQLDLAERCVTTLRSLPWSVERLALYWLTSGQIMEQRGDFVGAVECYRTALGMEPVDPNTWYLVHNNLGYSLVQLGQFEAAAAFCRDAMLIDPFRYNAHKNLGLSLEGLGQYPEAARSYLRAIRANPADRRALGHLRSLVAAHRELLVEVPEVGEHMTSG